MRPVTAPPLIGLIGRKRSGKDTFASVLIEERGFTKAGFADPLREMALAIDPIVEYDEAFNGCGNPSCCPTDIVERRYSDVLDAHGYEVAKDKFPEVRRFLQVLGTNAVRGILGPDTWVDLAASRIDARTGPLVLTDVRFPNEAKAISDRGGYLVRIVRPGQDEGDLHPSETALDDYPVNLVIDNDSTLEEFLAKARIVARYLAYVNPTPH